MKSIVSLFFILLTTQAGAIEHVVEYAWPRGAGRGETLDVQFHGVYLDDPVEVVGYSPGIRCLSVSAPASTDDKAYYAHGGKVTAFVTARLEIAKDCPLGEHVLRLRTRTELAEPVTFHVSPFPTVNETESARGENEAPAKAQVISLNSTVSGRILPGEDMDRDCFAVELKKGQRLGVVLESVRLGTRHHGGENDCQIRVIGPDGSELVRCDDTALLVQDPLASVTATMDGLHVVEVSQQMHTPGPHSFYRLHLGTFAIPTTAFPSGGRPGEKVNLRLRDAAGGDFEQTITLPVSGIGSNELDFHPFWAETGGVLTPVALPLRVTGHENVLETTGAKSRAFPAPVAFNGIIETDGEVDEWRVHMAKDEKLELRVFARTLGAPLDASISIRKAGAAPDSPPLAEADDATLAERGYWSCSGRLRPKDLLDPVLTFHAKETADYVLAVRDTRGFGGPEHVYRVEVSPHREGLHPFVVGEFAFKQPRAVAFTVPRGSRWTLNVSLGEGAGTSFKGDIELDAADLPPGVTMQAPRYVGGLRKMPVHFVADDSAKPGVHFIQLIARAVDGTPLAGAPQQGFTYTDRRGGFAWHHATLDRFALAVVDPAPMRVECSASRVSLARNGEVTLDLQVQREAGFGEPLELQADWLPPGVEKGPPVPVPSGQSTAQLRLRATANTVPGVWPITVTATTMKGDVLAGVGCRLVTSPVIELEVGDPYLTANFERAAIERGKRGELIASLTHHRPFKGKASAQLLRLPHGVRQIEPLPQITAGDKTCAFLVEVSTDALVGQYKQIAAEITILENNQPMRHQTGSATLRVDPAKGSK
jgi:hypothetical protein